MTDFDRLSRLVHRHLPDLEIATVIDVGANAGQSTLEFLRVFPECRVLAVEPVPQTAELLRAAVLGNERVEVVQAAASRAAGSVTMTADGVSTMNRIVPKPLRNVPTIEVETIRGDDLVASLAEQRVSYLKVDAEGHDLEVLLGFVDTLRAERIDLIQVEVGMNADNTRHVPFAEMQAWLEAFGMRLFAMLGVSYQPPSVPMIRRMDAVFVSGFHVRP